MSLTSRLSNLFASEPSSHLVPGSQKVDGSEHDAVGDDRTDASIARKIKRMRTMEKTETDENFELKRPPYLHVGHAGSTLCFGRADTVDSQCLLEGLGARVVIC